MSLISIAFTVKTGLELIEGTETEAMTLAEGRPANIQAAVEKAYKETAQAHDSFAKVADLLGDELPAEAGSK